MIFIKDDIMMEIRNFVEAVVGKGMPILNSDALTQSAEIKDRAEFRLFALKACGSTYHSENITDTYELVNETDYRCKIRFRIISNPENASRLGNRMIGAIQMFAMVHDLMPSISIQAHDMTTRSYASSDGGMVTVLYDVVVNATIAQRFTYEMSYFETIEDSIIDITE